MGASASRLLTPDSNPRPSQTEYAVESGRMQAAKIEARAKNYGLTRRELEIVSGVVAAMGNKEIAGYFKIAEDTVKHHLGNIFDKLGVSTGTFCGESSPALDRRRVTCALRDRPAKPLMQSGPSTRSVRPECLSGRGSI